MTRIEGSNDPKKMSQEIRPPSRQELPLVIQLLDQEFISKKNRNISLESRFPHTLTAENADHIRVLLRNGRISGACATRPFDWITKERVWRALMVGMVWIDSNQRGRGLGSALIESLPAFFKERGFDFGVLWTGSPAFYQRQGWRLNCPGLFGCAMHGKPRPDSKEIVCHSAASVAPEWMEAVRSTWVACRLARKPVDYTAIPIPSTNVVCFSYHETNGGEGFALVGVSGDTGYFLELAAPPAQWEAIWGEVARAFSCLYVNGYAGDPFSEWLSARGYVEWREQQKTMWYPVSSDAVNAAPDKWYIPYFDWI